MNNSERFPKEMSKTINGKTIWYTLDEETQTYIPNMTTAQTNYVIGKYGHMRENYLKNEKPLEYQRLKVQFKLNEHLHQTDKEAHLMLDNLIPKLKEQYGVTEQMKVQDQMKWVGMMNNIQQIADEIICRELIFN
ncbi:MAG: TnpV protein [Oscillospiraceae bacterium]|nr:TnpV protein [Oscillospiraceae bacterium]